MWFLEMHAGKTALLKCGLNHKPPLFCWIPESFGVRAFVGRSLLLTVYVKGLHLHQTTLTPTFTFI